MKERKRRMRTLWSARMHQLTSVSHPYLLTKLVTTTGLTWVDTGARQDARVRASSTEAENRDQGAHGCLVQHLKDSAGVAGERRREHIPQESRRAGGPAKTQAGRCEVVRELRGKGG